MTTRTTYPKAKLAAIKKRGGTYLATSILTDLYSDTEHMHPALDAEAEVNSMTTRQMYAMLKDCGFTFNTGNATWTAEVQS